MSVTECEPCAERGHECDGGDHCDRCGARTDGYVAATGDICWDCRRSLEAQVAELQRERTEFLDRITKLERYEVPGLLTQVAELTRERDEARASAMHFASVCEAWRDQLLDLRDRVDSFEAARAQLTSKGGVS